MVSLWGPPPPRPSDMSDHPKRAMLPKSLPKWQRQTMRRRRRESTTWLIRRLAFLVGVRLEKRQREEQVIPAQTQMWPGSLMVAALDPDCGCLQTCLLIEG